MVWTMNYLIFEDEVRKWPKIMTRIQVGEESRFSINGVWPRAQYTLETCFDGSVIDDWFVWEEFPRPASR